MAIWSAYAQGSDGNGLRVGIDVTRSGNTFTVRYYYQTEFNYNDSQTLNRTGSIGGSVGFQNNGGGPVLINTATFTGSPGGSYSFGANITGSYNGANPSVSASFAIPLSAPAAPGTPGVTRNSDTSHTLTWTRNATGSAPYTSQRVQRRYFVNGAWSGWSKIAQVSGGATSYTDTTTVAQRVYTWRVQSANGSGTAIGPQSIDVRTTPAPPKSASATKSGSDITITWANGPTYVTGYEVQVERSSAGGAFTLISTKTAGTTTHTDIAPNSGQTHQYRVRTRTTTAAAGLVSAYSTTATIQLLAPPNAPVNLAPTTVRDAASNITLIWTHNPVDTTGQTQLQVRHRALGSPVWTEATAVASATSSWTLPANTYPNGTTIEWQVRTRGQHATLGPYSASANIPTSATPTVAINEPADAAVVPTSQVSVEWGYFQAQDSPQASYRIELVNDGGQVVEVINGVGQAILVPLRTVLPDSSSWTVRVQVTSSAGLTSTADTNAFTVDYAVPPTPSITVEWSPETASATIETTIAAPAGAEVAAVAVNVYRSVDGQATWDLVTGPIPYTGTSVAVTDHAPRVAGVTSYYADAVSALPSVAASAITAMDPRDDPASASMPRVWLSVGTPSFDEMAWSGGDVSIERDEGIPRVLHTYAGSELATEHSGIEINRTWSVSLTLFQRHDGTMLLGATPFAWRRLARTPGPFLLRIVDQDDYALVSATVGAIRSPSVPASRVRRHSLSLVAREVRG